MLPSILPAERAYMVARRLLEQDPQAHDAYFVFGSTEHLVGRVSGQFARSFEFPE